jgi:hypothetical protein
VLIGKIRMGFVCLKCCFGEKLEWESDVAPAPTILDLNRQQSLPLTWIGFAFPGDKYFLSRGRPSIWGSPLACHPPSQDCCTWSFKLIVEFLIRIFLHRAMLICVCRAC